MAEAPTQTSAEHGSGDRLAERIRARRDEILRDWDDAARDLARARALDGPSLVDHVVELVERLGDGVGAPERDAISTDAARRAFARLAEGYDLRAVIEELHALRRAIVRACARPPGAGVTLAEVERIDAAIERAIVESVAHYTRTTDRMFESSDRVATAVVESETLDELLQRLLELLVASAPSIDTACIYLRDDDVLRARAVIGLGRDGELGNTIRIGEYFAGTVAARARPLAIHHPTAADVANKELARVGVRVLYGVPILEGDQVVGVAKIGSVSVDEFSPLDQRVFAAIVGRASVAILRHLLREQVARGAEQLAARERQFHALADNIAQLAWMADSTGYIYWYNRRWYDYTGATLDDMRGWGWQRVHHPDHVERVVASWRAALAAGEPWEDTFPLRGGDGRYRWFLSRAQPIRDRDGRIERWFGTHTDITARRFLDDATLLLGTLLDPAETLDQLARLVVPAVADWCVVDLVEGERLRHVATVHSDPRKLERARDFTRSYPAEHERDETAWNVLRTRRAQLVAEIDDAMLSGLARDAVRADALRELGFRSWIGAPIVARGRALGVIHMMLSESRRRYTAADLDVAVELGQRAGIAIDNARLFREAQDAIRMRDEVIAIVSHDLRNPLGAIDLAAGGLLGQPGLDARTRKQLDLIRRSSDRMAYLIGDLVDLASISAGRLTVAPVPADVARVLDDALELHQPLARERGIALARAGDAPDVKVLVDRNRIAQVFANLVDNALKFGRSGDSIELRAERLDDRVRFAVADSGPGIRREDLPHVFEAYWRGQQRADRKGSGLGLFITRAIVQAHGGEITVESVEGTGTTFAFTVPCAR
jgi:PAS domain S-box-containing protein